VTYFFTISTARFKKSEFERNAQKDAGVFYISAKVSKTSLQETKVVL
jgi:hypothetical protein